MVCVESSSNDPAHSQRLAESCRTSSGKTKEDEASVHIDGQSSVCDPHDRTDFSVDEQKMKNDVSTTSETDSETGPETISRTQGKPTVKREGDRRDKILAEILEAQSKKETLEVDLRNLSSEEQNLQRFLEKLRSEKQDLQASVKNLGCYKSDLEAHLPKLISKRQFLDDTVESLRSRKEGLEEDLNIFKNEKSMLERELGVLRTQKASLEGEIQTWSTLSAELSRTRDEAAAARQYHVQWQEYDITYLGDTLYEISNKKHFIGDTKKRISGLMDMKKKALAHFQKETAQNNEYAPGQRQMRDMEANRQQTPLVFSRQNDSEQRLAGEEIVDKKQYEDLRTAYIKIKQDLNELELKFGEVSSESGSFHGRSATPTDVSTCFTEITFCVKSFNSRFEKCMKNYAIDLSSKLVNRHYEGIKFRRNSNAPAVTLKASVMGILFRGFESEDFDIEGGAGVHPDPKKRKEILFSKFEHLRIHRHAHPEDTIYIEQEYPEFRQYYEGRRNQLWKIFDESVVKVWKQSTEADLDKVFRKAAAVVWTFHLLCFSFEPPASIFRVKRGAKFDANYMEPLQLLEMDESSVTEVAFMIAPAFRIGNFATIRSEIYPVLAPT